MKSVCLMFFLGSGTEPGFREAVVCCNGRVSIDAKKNEPILCKDGLGQLWI